MTKPSNTTRFAMSHDRRLVWVAVVVVLAAATVAADKAQADTIRPVVEINSPGISVLGKLFPTPSVIEGNEAVVFITVSNPSATSSLVVGELLLALNGFAGDKTDRLTLNGAVLFVNECGKLGVPGIAPGPGVILGPGSNCSDVFLINTLPLVVPDEGKPDSGFTTVNATAVTPQGVHSRTDTADIEVVDPPKVPEPNSLFLLMSGLLTLRWRILKRRRCSNSMAFISLVGLRHVNHQ
jgi:hypothetical protein